MNIGDCASSQSGAIGNVNAKMCQSILNTCLQCCFSNITWAVLNLLL